MPEIERFKMKLMIHIETEATASSLKPYIALGYYTMDIDKIPCPQWNTACKGQNTTLHVTI